MSYLVWHFDGKDGFAGDEHTQFLDWLKSVGVDLDVTLYKATVVQNGRQYELHTSQIDKYPVIDFCTGQVVSKPVVFDLGTERVWPKFLDRFHKMPVAA